MVVVEGISFNIDLKSKKKTSMVDGKVYQVAFDLPLQGMGGPTPMGGPMQPPLPSKPVVKQYFWAGDGEKPVPYDAKVNGDINQAVATGKTEVKYNFNGTDYIIDLKRMKQKNSKTGFERTVTVKEEGPQAVIPPTVPGEFMPYWQSFSQQQNLTIIKLPPTDPEYQQVEKKFKETQKSNIIEIQKVYNTRLRMLFDLELSQVKQKYNNDPSIPYIKLLFHGTSKTEPSFIYNGEKGFMMQFAAEGMWGRGTYFAEKATYSNNYAFHTPQGKRQMFLAEVIVGESHYCEPDRTLKVPPEKKNKRSNLGLASERYDSVSGTTGGSKVWIVYDNNKAYPSYLITYSL